MDFPIHIDRISKRFAILYLKGSQVEVSLQCILSLKFVLILANSEYPDEMQHYGLFTVCQSNLFYLCGGGGGQYKKG